MNFLKRILAFVILASLLSGCTAQNAAFEPSSSENSSISSEEPSSGNLPETAVIFENKEIKLSGRLSEEQLANLPTDFDGEYNYTVVYPEFSGDSAEKLNTLVKDLAMQTINEYGSGYTADSEYAASAIEETFSVEFYDGKRVSIGVSGICTIPSAAYPWVYMKTFNYDIENDKLLQLSDLVTVDDAFKEKAAKALKDTLYEQKPEAYEYLCDDFSDDVDNIDKSEPEYAEYTFYFSEKSVTLVIPTIHALGSYECIEVEL